MSGGIAAACIVAGTTAAVAGTKAGMDASAAGEASDAARAASEADAHSRALAQTNAESENAAKGIMGMVGPAGGDPTVQRWLDQANKDYLAQRGLLQPGAQPGGAVPGQPGQPGQPVDPLNPGQPSNPSSNYKPPGLGK